MLRTDNLQSSLDRLNGDYGEEWLTWLPETLSAEVFRNYGGIENIDRDRLLAARNLLTHGQFWTTVNIFGATTLAFNWVDVGMNLDMHPSPGQIVLAVKICNKVVDPHGTSRGQDLSSLVLDYIASIFLERSYVYVPLMFGMLGLQDILDRYHRDPALVGAVAAKWESMMDHSWSDLDENEVDVQCGRLLAIKKFVDLGGVSRQRDKVDALYKIILE